MTEVEIGIGRPDIVLMAVDQRTLSLRRMAGLRLGGLTEAHALSAASAAKAMALAETDHQRRLARGLVRLGWFELDQGCRVATASLLLEAKVSAWRQGLRQLSRARWAADQAALILPDEVASRVPTAMLRRPRLGLITVDDDGDVRWKRQAPSAPLPFFLDAWLGELAIRELERACVDRT